MSKANAAVDALHAHCVLFVLVEPREYFEQLSLADLWDKLDHVVENNCSLLPDLRRLVLGDRIVHSHEFLLRSGSDLRVHAREELNRGELGSEAISIHQPLDHAHDRRFKVPNPDHRQNLLNTLRGLNRSLSHRAWFDGQFLIVKARSNFFN